ncbi:MAG: C1 family peptidase, partial [Gammaproteobacteria bacterium]|nr:C1 family peptidase [Gammaproteobacteria bacterium]
MTETWGNLEENERKIIASRARKLSDTELQERFEKKDDVVVFNILKKTDRSLAGILDMDKEDEENHEELPEDAVDAKEAIEEEEALEEENQDHEIFQVTLISPEDFDYEPEITDEDNEAAQVIDESVSAHGEYYTQDTVYLGDEVVITETEAESAGLPSIIDHRPNQSPIKDQGGRGTCVAHASLALLEAYNHIPDDLSEQCAHYKYNEFLGRPHNVNAGLKTTMAAPFLARNDGRVCLESDWPYIPDQNIVDALVALGTYRPSQSCQNNEKYGYGSYKIITDRGLVGESIKNTRYLEALLYKGYNVVVGTWVSWDDKDNNGVLDPVLDPFGRPIGRGGHAMLIVGYNRPGQYFIVKNSWGRGWGHNGYAYLHYNLARSCFKYGFVVHSVVPPAPTLLPAKLARAPYSTQKISRSKL